jgi:hypothetical protein
MLNEIKLGKGEFELPFKAEVSQYLSTHNNLNVPLIDLYVAVLELIENPTETIYYTTKNIFSTYPYEFTQLENRNFFTYLENAARIIFTEPTKYYKELFVLYKEQLAKRIPYTDGHLSVMYFRNVITVALMNNDTEWAEQFLIDNQNSIREAKDDVWNLCQAQVFFAKGDYDGAINALNTAYFTNIYFKLDDRQLRLKVYYELNEIDVLDSFINSYKKFLFDNTDKIEERVLNGHRNFLAIVSKLLSLPYHSPPEREKLYTQFKEAGAMPNKHWLEEKIKARLA